MTRLPPLIMADPQASSVSTLCQLPYPVWEKTCKYLPLCDLFRLFFIKHATIQLACRAFLMHQHLRFNVVLPQCNRAKNNGGCECPEMLKIMKRLGCFVQKVLFYADTVCIEPNTYDCMRSTFLSPSSKLKPTLAVELEVHDLNSNFFEDTTEGNWFEFLHLCTEGKTKLEITAFSALCIWDPFKAISDSKTLQASDPRCRLLMTLSVKKIQDAEIARALISRTDSGSSLMSDFLAKFPNLVELSVDVSCVHDVLLYQLTRTSPSLKKLNVFEKFLDELETVTADTWNHVTSALPKLEVAYDCSDWGGASTLLNESTPLSEIQVFCLMHVELSEFLDWCKQFGKTLKRTCWNVCLDVYDRNEVIKSVRSFCDRTTHLRHTEVVDILEDDPELHTINITCF